jgi:hypothetical protein
MKNLWPIQPWMYHITIKKQPQHGDLNFNNRHEKVVTDFEKCPFHQITHCIHLEVTFLFNLQQLMLFVTNLCVQESIRFFSGCFDCEMFLESLNDRWERSLTEKPWCEWEVYTSEQHTWKDINKSSGKAIPVNTFPNSSTKCDNKRKMMLLDRLDYFSYL